MSASLSQNGQEYGTLMYTGTPILQHDSAHSVHNSMAGPWNPHEQHSASSNSASSGPMFSDAHHTIHHVDFPTNSSSLPFPHAHADVFGGHHHIPGNSPPTSQNVQSMPTNLNQVDSSVGPCRITSRGRRHSSDLRTDALSKSSSSSGDTVNRNEQHHASLSASRPQTPNNVSGQNPYPRQRHSVSFSMGRSPLSVQSSRYTSTPPSISPSFPSYGFYHPGSRSSYSLSNPRSASPALSVASTAMTSISDVSLSERPFAYNAFTDAWHGDLTPLPGRKHKKRKLTNGDRKEICLDAIRHPGSRQEDIASRFGVERSTVSKILKNKHKFLNIPEGEEMRVSKHRPSKFPEMEAEIEKWLQDMKDTSPHALLTDALLRQRAIEVARSLGIDGVKFKASQGWIENFKARQGIRGGVWPGPKKLPLMQASVLSLAVSKDPALSPLNPAFDPRLKSFNGGGSDMPLDEEDGYESEEDYDVDDADHREERSQTLGTLQPAWQGSSSVVAPSDHPHSLSDTRVAPPTSYDQSEAQSSSPAAHPQSGSLVQSSDVAQPCPPSELQAGSHGVNSIGTDYISAEHHHGRNNGYVGVAASSNGVPALSDIEESISKVITFVDAQGEGFITWEEHEALRQVRHAILQAAHRLPYARSAS